MVKIGKMDWNDPENRKLLDPDLQVKLAALERKIGKVWINSGKRTQEENVAVGGAKRSQHLFGKAIDIAVPKGREKDFYEAVKEVGFTGIGRGEQHGFIHADVRAGDRVEWSYNDKGQAVGATSTGRVTTGVRLAELANQGDSAAAATLQGMQTGLPSDPQALASQNAELLSRFQELNATIQGNLALEAQFVNRLRVEGRGR